MLTYADPRPKTSLKAVKKSDDTLKRSTNSSSSSSPTTRAIPSPNEIVPEFISVCGKSENAIFVDEGFVIKPKFDKDDLVIYRFAVSLHPMKEHLTKTFRYLVDEAFEPRLIGGPLAQSFFRNKYLTNDEFTYLSNHVHPSSLNSVQINLGTAAFYTFKTDADEFKYKLFHCYETEEVELVTQYMKNTHYHNDDILYSQQYVYVSNKCLLSLYFDVVYPKSITKIKMTDDALQRYTRDTSVVISEDNLSLKCFADIFNKKSKVKSVRSDLKALYMTFYKRNVNDAKMPNVWY